MKRISTPGELKAEAKNDRFKRAADCAKNGDPLGMLVALADQHALDGYYRYFSNRYSNLPSTAIEEAIGLATDAAYAHLQAGKKIFNLSGWLWKVIESRLNDAWTTEHALNRPFDDERHGGAASNSSGGLAERSAQIDRQGMRNEAIRVAREMLPTLGHKNIENVMKLILDAAENGVEDLPHAEIAETLDLNPNTVRVLVWRGFRRIARAAKKRGLHVDRARLKDLFPDIPADGEDEDLDEE